MQVSIKSASFVWETALKYESLTVTCHPRMPSSLVIEQFCLSALLHKDLFISKLPGLPCPPTTTSNNTTTICPIRHPRPTTTIPNTTPTSMYDYQVAKTVLTDKDKDRLVCLYLNRRADGNVRTVSPITPSPPLTTYHRRSIGTKPPPSSSAPLSAA